MFRLLIAAAILFTTSFSFAAESLKDYSATARDYEQKGIVNTVNLGAYRITINGKPYNLTQDVDIITSEGENIQQGSRVEYSLKGESINGLILLK